MNGYTYTLVSDALTYASDINQSPRGETSALTWDVLEPFVVKVCKDMRVKACPKDWRSCYIYREDFPYVLGWIGYGDWRMSGSRTPMYIVQARTIDNGKYDTYSPQFFMKMSANFDVAVRNAKKFLRIMSPQELASTRLQDASNAVDNVVDVARTEFAEIRGKVIDLSEGYSVIGSSTGQGSILLNELRHLMNSNHAFLDSTFGDKQAELIRLKTRVVPMWFVRVYERMDQQVFDVISVGKNRELKMPTSGDVTRYTTDTLPEDLMQKLSVLNILQANDYVDDVGFSAGDGMFYVVR